MWFFFSTTDRLISSAYVRMLSRNKEDRGRSEGGGKVSLFIPLHPGLPGELKLSVRKGWEEREWALDDPYKLP